MPYVIGVPQRWAGEEFERACQQLKMMVSCCSEPSAERNSFYVARPWKIGNSIVIAYKYWWPTAF